MSSEVEAAVPVPEMDVPMTEATKEVVAKEEKTAKRGRKLKKKASSPSHPPYFQMIKEAVVALNEKGGSSPYAIAKYMEQKHKAVLPRNFRKILGLQLKNSVSKGKLIKVRASYKLSETVKMKRATKAARANAAKEPAKRRKPKSRAISNIDNPPTNPTARRSKRSTKPKQLKTIKSAKNPA